MCVSCPFKRRQGGASRPANLNRQRQASDALFLWVNVRTVIGAGHGAPDRGSFSLTSHGMVWIEMAAFYPHTWANTGSIMVINGLAQYVRLRMPAPCKVLQFTTDAITTVAVADLSLPYEPFACRSYYTGNSRRLNRSSSLPWMDTPRYRLPRFPNFDVPNGVDDGGVCPASSLTHTRSTRLVRGAHLNTSYVLLSDDITLASPRTRADGTQTLASQLALPGHAFYQNRRFPNARVYECANESDGVSRMMLSEAPGCVDSPGSRRMLITVLNSSLPMRMHMQGCAVDGGSGCGGSANGVTQHFVVMNATGGHWRLQLLLWPHRRGQLEPVITQTSSTFAIEWPGQADVWRLDSPYGAHPTGLLRNGATAQTARAFDKATARVNGVPYTQIRRPPSPPPPEPPPSPPFSPPSTPPSDGACFAEECVGSCPFRCQVFSGVVGSCVGAKSNRCSCPPALPWCVA